MAVIRVREAAQYATNPPGVGIAVGASGIEAATRNERGERLRPGAAFTMLVGIIAVHGARSEPARATLLIHKDLS